MQLLYEHLTVLIIQIYSTSIEANSKLFGHLVGWGQFDQFVINIRGPNANPSISSYSLIPDLP